MYFYPLDVTTPHIIYALLGAFIVLFGMFSLFLRERLYVGEAIWAFIFGIIIGPYGANIFNPRAWGHSSNPEEPINLITLEFTRVVLAIGLFALGVELPKAYMVKHWKSLFVFLVPVTTWGWFVCAGLIYALIPGVNFLSSLAISACLTPTDPILASAVVGGKWADKHVPAHIRHLFAAESGCNGGAAFAFLFFALFLMTNLPNVGHALRDWFLILWLYHVVLGILLGSFLGFSFRYLMKFCQRHDLIDRQSYVAQYLSLAFLTIGITTLLGCDDLLAAFACGTSFAWDGFFNNQTRESVFSSVIDILFNIAAFIFVGAWMPFDRFHIDVDAAGSIGLGVEVWRLVVLAVLVLLLRRLPIMMAMYKWIPDVKTWREAVFIGHFGPMGIGAIFISTVANQFLIDHVELNPSGGPSTSQRHQIEVVRDLIQPVVSFMVLCSITIHGLSISGFSLGQRMHSVTRTWSRRDTTGSGRVGAPDWTNQARLVTRAEDIVINRDLERGEGGRGVPLEKTMTIMSMRTLNNGNNSDDQKEDGMKSDSKSEIQVDPVASITPTKKTTTIQNHAKIGDEQDYDDYRNQFVLDGDSHQTSEWIEGNQRVVERRVGGDVEVTVIDASPHRTASNENLTSRIGHKLHEMEREAGEGMRDGVWRNLGFGRRRVDGGGGSGDGEEVEMGNRKRPTTADTLVAEDDTDGVWISDASHYSQEEAASGASTPGTGGGAESAIRGETVPQERRNMNPPDAINLNLDTDHPFQVYDDYDSDLANANTNADNEITEVPRGREGRPQWMNNNNTARPPSRRTMSGSGSSLLLSPRIGMGRTLGGMITPPRGLSSAPLPLTLLSPSSSTILPSIFPSPNLPPTNSRSRPWTAPSSSTTSITTTSIASSPAPPPTLASRPGTADSSSNNSIRHHRLDSIRTGNNNTVRQGHRTPPRTRESSPSRSVRFVDGESRDASGNGSGAKTVMVVEIPPPMPFIPRSSSFYRDGGGGGGASRTLVDNPVEEEGPCLNVGTSSRPPTR